MPDTIAGHNRMNRADMRAFPKRFRQGGKALVHVPMPQDVIYSKLGAIFLPPETKAFLKKDGLLARGTKLAKSFFQDRKMRGRNVPTYYGGGSGGGAVSYSGLGMRGSSSGK